MPGPDPSHWLQRLTGPEWLAAAENDLAAADEALARRAYRPAVTHARRAAGMALNAVLLMHPQKAERWGRSYMEHVAALSSDEDVPEEIRAAAALLRATTPGPPALVTLGGPDRSSWRAANIIIGWARATAGVAPTTS